MGKKTAFAVYLHLIKNFELAPSMAGYKFYVRNLFQGVSLKNKTALDIGAGSGLYSFFMALRGAKKVIGLEPEFKGSKNNYIEKFNQFNEELKLKNIVLETVPFQKFEEKENKFDVILLHHSINHLDEDACMNLAKSPAAIKKYEKIFQKLYRMASDNAEIIIADCSNKNFYASLGVKNFFAPSIEWQKHQAPEVWIAILRKAGFGDFRIKWLAPAQLGKLGDWVLGNKMASYLIHSTFIIYAKKKTQETYEESYKKNRHFSFGRNWQKFLLTLNYQKIKEAEKSLVEFIGSKEKIKDKEFVDIGCGSGLFSLAACKLGAKKVVSVDIDDFSLACVRHLKEEQNNPKNWQIKKGSALDSKMLEKMGEFDIVYSWGVLHHTGNMREAIGNVAKLAKKGGLFYLAIYNNNTQNKLEGTSMQWEKIKKTYNRAGRVGKKTMETIYLTYFIAGLLANRKNPISYISNYSTLRGMDFFTDIRDWLGGYPYEFADQGTIIEFMKEHNFECEKCRPARSIGCNEFLFRKL